MRIAFDAKRAYHNHTGLGNYSRTLIRDLAKYYPDNQYLLFNTKKSNSYYLADDSVTEILPHRFMSRALPSLWRSKWVISDLVCHKIDLYHGLSHEIPHDIQKTSIKSVVTIHDLIFERYPEQYNMLDVSIYRRKFKYACHNSDRIIAISEQTKHDIVDYYKVPADKIDVCYQSCDESFHPEISEAQKKDVISRLKLPAQFFLSVGSIVERKNLINICRAMLEVKKVSDITLVVIGRGEGSYKKKVIEFIMQNGLEDKVVFMDKVLHKDLPTIYSLSRGLVYPSYFEGFGIPVLEALSVGVPVVTSSSSCLPEAGGDAALYADPAKPEQIAACMIKILRDNEYVRGMIRRGFVQAAKFSNEKCAEKVMETYRKLIPTAAAANGIS